MDNLAVCIQNDDKTVTPFETVDAIYKAGFRNVFVQYYRRQNIDYDELEVIDYCRKLGLNILFCHLGYSDINEIWYEGETGEKVTQSYIDDLDLMHEKNINMVCMHLITHKESPEYNEIGLERIKKITKHAKELGIKVAFENTRKKGYLDFVLGNIKDENVGICFDSGHYHVFFNDELDWELFKDRIFCVHLHDNDQSFDQHLLPGDGTLDWNETLRKIRKYGYTGPLTLELCYRNDYLEMNFEDFYKEGYLRGKKLQEIDEKVKL